MSRDWYKDHNASPDAYPESEYLEWVQDQGIYVDAAGNVQAWDTDDGHVFQYMDDDGGAP